MSLKREEAAIARDEVRDALVAAGWADIRINRALELMESEDDATRRDAERYRWLCAGRGYFLEERGLCGNWPDKEASDAAIDEEWETYFPEPGAPTIPT